MQFIIKYRWALIGTVFLHLGILLYLQTKKVEAPYQSIQMEVPIVLEDLPDNKKTEDEQEKEKLQQANTGKVSNITANEADKVGKSEKRYDSRSIDAQVEQELRDFEKSQFDALASGRKTDITINEEKDKPKNKEKVSENNNNNSESGKVRSPGRVSGSYDLDGRKDEYFAKPAYVCKGSGTVVLKVKVNRNGRVVHAEIDQSASSFTESCMGENSLVYVKKCKFEAGTQWPEPQSGTVTYTFIAQ